MAATPETGAAIEVDAQINGGTHSTEDIPHLQSKVGPSISGTPHKRRRRTKAQVEQLEAQILAVLTADHPQSIRHVFYRMTDPRLPEPVTKNQNGYDQVQNRITQMRRAGTLPYGWISDTSRRGWHVATFDGPADFLRRVTGLYRANLWASTDHYVEVWVESRSIAGVIQEDCNELAISLYPCGGFSSISFAYEGAEDINERTKRGEKPAEIIYIGDYDPAGVLVDGALEAELREHLDPDVELTLHRIAITAEQIERYGLPTKPRNPKDRRSLHITETVEAEAMPAGILRALLHDAVEQFLPPRALAVARAAEESEREILERWAASLGELYS